MICPDWPRLVARRDDDPVAWTEALAHHDHCSACRAEALEADPLLLFRRLPAPGLDRTGIDEVHRGVATLRRARSLEVAEPRRARRVPWAAAAAAGLALLMTGAPPIEERRDPAPTDPVLAAAPAVAPGDARPIERRTLLGAVGVVPTSTGILSELPLVEDLETAGPFLQVDGRDLTVVMVQRARPRGDV